MHFSSLIKVSLRIYTYNISLLDILTSIFLKLAISLNFLTGNTDNLSSFTGSLLDIFLPINLLNLNLFRALFIFSIFNL